MYGAIEAGGTKFICAVAENADQLLAKTSFPTTTPEETMAQAVDFFSAQAQSLGEISAIGVGSFGPVNICKTSRRYGYIASAPKPGWPGFDLVGYLEKSLPAKITIDTDVNCALLGEHLFGAGRGLEDFVYVTIGTGVGGGVLVNGSLAHGFSHPELGHMLVPKHPDDQFSGVCPFHGDQCLEGLASGPAIAARWGENAQDLPPDHRAWDFQEYYLAVMCTNILLTSAPRAIVLGGGVMKQGHLFPRIRRRTESLLKGYIDFDELDMSIEKLIVPVELAGDAGVAGAIVLAQQATSA